MTLGTPHTAPPRAETERPSGLSRFFSAVRDLFAGGLRNLRGLFEPARANTPAAPAQQQATGAATSHASQASTPQPTGAGTAPEPTENSQVRADAPSGDVAADAAVAKKAMRQLSNIAQTQQNERAFLRGAEGKLLTSHFKTHAGDHFKNLNAAVIADPSFSQHDGFAYEGTFHGMGTRDGDKDASAQRGLRAADAFLEAQLGALDHDGEPDPVAIRAAAARVPQAVCDLLKGVCDGIDASQTPCDKQTLKDTASINYVALRLITPEIVMGSSAWSNSNPGATSEEKTRVQKNCLDASKLVTSMINQAGKEQGKEQVHPSIENAFEARKAAWGGAFKLFAAEVAARGR